MHSVTLDDMDRRLAEVFELLPGICPDYRAPRDTSREREDRRWGSPREAPLLHRWGRR